MLRSERLSLPALLRPQVWPHPLSDDATSSQINEFPPTYERIKSHVHATGDIMIRVVTWNQEAKETPTPEELAKILFPSRKYHIIAVGTQECENTFAKSIITPSKVKWEAMLESALGMDYDVVRSHSLQTSHIILFAHKSIVHLLSNVRSRAVPTGIGDTLGNKGGIGIALSIGESTFIFVNAHLSAHQHATERRTREFYKICNGLATKIWKRDSETSAASSSSANNGEEEWAHRDRYDINISEEADVHENLLDDGDIISDPTELAPLLHSNMQCTENDNSVHPNANPLVNAFDHVFIFGDLNFRINGTREIIDGMLEYHMHDALLCNDQLTMLLQFNRIFFGFNEGPLNFFPTYKFDHNSGERIDIEYAMLLQPFWNKSTSFSFCGLKDQYDSSHRRRVPSWTDRVLFKSDECTQVLSYCSAPDIRTSDHRPVYATFRSRIQFDNESSKKYTTPLWEGRGETRSEVCCIS
ncbi:hypothetical protein ACHAWU_007056 [Discostella pseudostelligera]|uniref:Inositol polyphosphate-related phosphatase domain-containing protein n=1 Tax=Discostella pseudostelligera TaxID=259834 RepID=A0ABD3MB60_9STRA